jgi:hypothetical protein
VFLFSISTSVVITSNNAGASSWSSYLNKCKTVLIDKWAADYTNLSNQLGATNISGAKNAANAFGLLGAQEIGCSNSPDKTLNSQIQSLTYYQTVAMLQIKQLLSGSGSTSAAGNAIQQMSSKWKTMSVTLAKDQAYYG